MPAPNHKLLLNGSQDFFRTQHSPNFVLSPRRWTSLVLSRGIYSPAFVAMTCGHTQHFPSSA